MKFYLYPITLFESYFFLSLDKSKQVIADPNCLIKFFANIFFMKEKCQYKMSYWTHPKNGEDEY